MSILADALRPYWLPGLQNVTGRREGGFATWIVDQDYQIYRPITPTAAVLNFSESTSLLQACAGDCSKMIVAALESVDGLDLSSRLPKGMGWFIIRLYYSSYFAAHGILRMFGQSLTQFDENQTRAINRIADLYGMSSDVKFGGGYHLLEVNLGDKELSIQKIDSSTGSHASMWTVFRDFLLRMSNGILQEGHGTLPHQQVAIKLADLATILTKKSTQGQGGWLSTIRNKVNYRHELSAWYPYAGRPEYYERLRSIAEDWKEDPMAITFWPHQDGRDLQRFTEACTMIIAMSRALALDMQNRCMGGLSFHVYGCHSLLQRLNTQAA